MGIDHYKQQLVTRLTMNDIYVAYRGYWSKLHKLDGPVMIKNNGDRYWCTNDKVKWASCYMDCWE